jgi:hypothetical protein
MKDVRSKAPCLAPAFTDLRAPERKINARDIGYEMRGALVAFRRGEKGDFPVPLHNHRLAKEKSRSSL